MGYLTEDAKKTKISTDPFYFLNDSDLLYGIIPAWKRQSSVYWW